MDRDNVFSIAQAERETGLSKDTLRKWEQRYGFPSPQRDRLGDRVYTVEQVEHLRLVRRAVEAGHRPGRLVGLPGPQLAALASSPTARDAQTALAGGVAATTDDAALRRCLGVVRSRRVDQLGATLSRELADAGLSRFVTAVVAPLLRAVGEAWSRGELGIYEEHLVSRAVEGALGRAIADLESSADEPCARVLLTTLPGEQHGLGLLMAQALLALDGAACIPLGTGTPVDEIVRATLDMDCDIVGIGTSAAMRPDHLVGWLEALRDALPAAVALWVGGAAPVLGRRAIPGVRVVGDVGELRSALAAWRLQLRPGGVGRDPGRAVATR